MKHTIKNSQSLFKRYLSLATAVFSPSHHRENSYRSKNICTQSGFTLIELLVVIAIIGTLASVVLASLNGAREKSRNAYMASTIKEVEKALELYWLDNNGQYPNTAGWACIGGSDNTCWNGTGNFDREATFDSAMQQYLDFTSITIPHESDSIEGIAYRDAVGGQLGYEIIYVIEGTDVQCPVGFNRVANQAGSGNTTCTVCKNYSGANCTDLF